MAKNLNWEDYRDNISQISSLDYNYDEKMYHDSKDKSGWNIDKYHASIGVEPTGVPVPDGAFDRVKNAIRLYQFPDPKLITAVFDPNGPLPGRNMLMFAHFAGLTFNFGVRVTNTIDEIKSDGKSRVQTWGYSYRTLRGHFEIGEITFKVSKNLDTGEIFFDIEAYSKPEKIPNLFYRTGFRIFSRPLQKYFAKSSIRRLKEIAQSATKDPKIKSTELI